MIDGHDYNVWTDIVPASIVNQTVEFRFCTESPTIPTNFDSTDKATNYVALSWNSVTDASSYEVQYRNPGDTWTAVIPVPPSWTTIIIPDLDTNTEYEFQVRAVNSVGNSEWSASVFVTTEPETLPAFTGAEVVWGLFYPVGTISQPATNPNPDPPTGEQLLELGLEGFFEISGDPTTSFIIEPAISASDWESIFEPGEAPSIYTSIAKLFILIREGEGTITNITNDLNGMSQFAAYEPYSVVIDGITYNGVVGRQALNRDGNTPFRVTVTP
jgi:hypothetical protein